MAAGVAGSRRRTGPRRPAREKAHTQPWAAPLGKSPFRVRRPRARTQPSPQSEPARPGTSSRRPEQTGPDQTGPDRTGPERTGPDQTGQASPRPACPATRRKRLRTALGCPAADHFRGETKMIGWPTRTARAGPDRRTRTERPAQDSRGRAGPTGARKKARRTWRAFRVLFGGSLRIWRQSARKR